MREYLTTNIVSIEDELNSDELTDQEKIERLVKLTTLQACLTEYLLEQIESLHPIWNVNQS